MIVQLLALLINTAEQKYADRIQEACERHLVADDPFEFAEETTKDLLAMYEHTREPKIEKELRYRLAAGMLYGDDRVNVEKALGGERE